MSEIKLYLDKDMLDRGIKLHVVWDYRRAPHVLAIGGTGSGKTYAMQLLLGRIGLHVEGAGITVLDFKADGDFDYLKGCAAFYTGMDCVRGFHAFYAAFERRQRGEDTSRAFRLLCVDELAAGLNMADKKEAEKIRAKLANLLMLGRSFNVHVLVGVQRPDAEYFGKARDNFSLVLAFGNLSSEGKQMFFNAEQRAAMQPVYEQGAGYMLTLGAEMKRIQVQAVPNVDKLRDAIRRSVLVMEKEIQDDGNGMP